MMPAPPCREKERSKRNRQEQGADGNMMNGLTSRDSRDAAGNKGMTRFLSMDIFLLGFKKK